MKIIVTTNYHNKSELTETRTMNIILQVARPSYNTNVVFYEDMVKKKMKVIMYLADSFDVNRYTNLEGFCWRT